MSEAAEAMNTAVEAVDAGGRVNVFGRPDDAIEPHGPIAEVLAERIDGSAAQVHAAGVIVGQRNDGIANRVVNGDPS